MDSVGAFLRLAIFSLVWCCRFSGMIWGEEEVASSSRKYSQPLTMEECIQIALENNRQRPAAKMNVATAEARHGQALSAWYPRFTLNSRYTKTDEPPNFVFPSETSSYQISGVAPVPVTTQVNIPEKDITVMGTKTLVHGLEMKFPLFTGGIRKSGERQAGAGVRAAREELRKSELRVIHQVERSYFGVVAARNLRRIVEETRIQLETTLELTERLYTRGSGKTKKTDFLRNKVMVETAWAGVAEMQGNEAAAKAALVTCLGLAWNTPIEVASQEIPAPALPLSLEQTVATAFRFNPDWAAFKAGLAAAEAAITGARGGNLPKLALFGNLHAIHSDLDSGIMSPKNKHGWALGIGLEVPVFDGNLTLNQIREARARLQKLEHEKILLREGIALQIQSLFFKAQAAHRQVTHWRSGLAAAVENRELNIRAYQDELVETKDVIESQLTEAAMKMALENALFAQASLRSELAFVVGDALQSWFRQDHAPGGE
jgi:outer membrane protein TolC